jgi:hypothetical protein
MRGARYILLLAAMWLSFVTACAGPSNRIADFLVGFEPAEGKQSTVLPLVVGLVIALPEAELGKVTTPSVAEFDSIAQRIQKELQVSPNIRVGRIFPTFVIAAGGLGAVSLERLRRTATDTTLPRIIVAVPTSHGARKVYFRRVEDQLFARMDAALVDLTTGRVLVRGSGQDDYILAHSYYDFTYPRLYYRTFTVAGPFTIVSGDPFKALGNAAFSGTADQIGMKLRRLVDPTPQAQSAVAENHRSMSASAQKFKNGLVVPPA